MTEGTYKVTVSLTLQETITVEKKEDIDRQVHKVERDMYDQLAYGDFKVRQVFIPDVDPTPVVETHWHEKVRHDIQEAVTKVLSGDYLYGVSVDITDVPRAARPALQAAVHAKGLVCEIGYWHHHGESGVQLLIAWPEDKPLTSDFTLELDDE